MAVEVKEIDWSRLEVTIPAFVTIIMMPLTYSVATGIALGFILYPFAMIARREWKQVHPIMYTLGGLFIMYFVFL